MRLTTGGVDGAVGIGVDGRWYAGPAADSPDGGVDVRLTTGGVDADSPDGGVDVRLTTGGAAGAVGIGVDGRWCAGPAAPSPLGGVRVVVRAATTGDPATGVAVGEIAESSTSTRAPIDARSARRRSAVAASTFDFTRNRPRCSRATRSAAGSP